MADTKANIAILILAAGASKRMGATIKQLLPWNTTTLLGNAINTARKSSANQSIVVLGAHASVVKSEIKNLEQVAITHNTDWKLGMGSSIACGVRNLLQRSTPLDGVLVVLADQPLIDTDYLNHMIDHFNEKDIIATDYGERKGVPALFGKAYFSELVKLNADYGAKDILERHKEHIFAIKPYGKEIDVDTLEDYHKLSKK
ncbi:MAG: nucleotidyltransferase family protein [Saonia sp.]